MKNVKEIVFTFFVMSCPVFMAAQNTKHYPLGMDEMFEIADKNSRSIRTYTIAEQEAAQSVRVVKNAMLPSVDLSLSASFLGDGRLSDRNFSHGENAPMPHFGNNLAIEASQVVYAGGSVSNGIALAELGRQLAALDKENNRQDIRFLLAGNYLELYKQNNQAEVYLKNIEQTQRLLSDIKAKQKEGLALKNDITRYELQLKSLELALVQTKNNKIIMNDQLVTVLGLPRETVIEIDTAILEKLPGMSAEFRWQETAGAELPVLKQARFDVELSRITEKINKAEYLPSVFLFAGEHLDGPITIEVPPINKNFNYWYAGIGLKFNIASTYKSGKKVRLAELSKQKAAEGERLLRESVRTEVTSAYVRFTEAFTIYETQLKSLELAVQNYEVIRNRYLNELALITDMLDASNSKLDAELQLANARINILFNYYRLKRVSGNL